MLNTKIIIVNEKRCLVRTEEEMEGVEKALIVLDLSEPCDYPDLDVLPAKIIEYTTYQERHEICKCNIILGEI